MRKTRTLTKVRTAKDAADKALLAFAKELATLDFDYFEDLYEDKCKAVRKQEGINAERSIDWFDDALSKMKCTAKRYSEGADGSRVLLDLTDVLGYLYFLDIDNDHINQDIYGYIKNLD